MFASGKLVCSSAKTEREVYEAVYKLKRIVGEINVMELSFPSGKRDSSSAISLKYVTIVGYLP